MKIELCHINMFYYANVSDIATLNRSRVFSWLFLCERMYPINYEKKIILWTRPA